MAVDTLNVTYNNTLVADLGIAVDNKGQVYFAVNPGNPNECKSLLHILELARNQLVQNFAVANNPDLIVVPLRGATGVGVT